MSKKGYYGVGVLGSKFESNIGVLWRHAYLYGADFIFTIGKRYKHDATDTTKASKHIPLYNYTDWNDFIRHLPEDCKIVCVEQTPASISLPKFGHPANAVYVLGAEDTGIPVDILQNEVSMIIEVPTEKRISMNVATAGTIVMFDRFVKSVDSPNLGGFSEDDNGAGKPALVG